MTQENSQEVLKKLKMKVSDIIKEGVLGSLVKGMAKGAGLGDVTLAKRPGRLPSAASVSATGSSNVATPKRTSSKNDMQVVVDKPGQPLTVRYGGQLYSIEGGKGSKWVMTKTGREVNQHFQQVLNTEWERYVGGNN